MQKINTRKKLGSYPSVGVVISITLALFVTGLFGLLIISSQELERVVRENIKLQVYLKNGLTDTQRTQVEKKLEQLPYINQTVSEKPVVFISKEEAAKKFIAETGEDFNQFLGENPLHDAYVLTIDPAYHSKTSMEKISAELEKMNGVFEVFFVEGLIESINKNVTRLGVILAAIIALLLVTVVLLINNTLRLALFSQRFLVRSMQLIGARKWFIQRPFLFRALVYGALSGLLATGGIWLLVNYANQNFEDLVLIENKDRMMMLSAALVVLGMLVAIISSYFAIRKYLKMSLDELY
ncbi:MAG: permease-like cell division protein FtsX [Cyclobacteriaceae bacterium]